MLGEADYGTTQMAFRDGRTSEQDAKLIVNFEMRPHLDKKRSSEEGRPIFTPKEYVTIIVPGDKNNVVCRPVWEKDKQRFPRQYQAFLNNHEQNVVGTPLEQVPWITREQVEELKFFHVRTLENLADMPDSNAQRFMGINKLRQRARDHIAAAKEAAPIAMLQEELRKRDATLNEMKALLEKQSAKIAALEDADEDEEPKARARK